ncbi:MAG: HEPN domain-containing protein [Dehalococcoidia bacterium]
MRIENRTFHDPPRPNEIEAVLGLRGGAAVLMVGAFEAFLRDLCPEVLARVDSELVEFSRLPEAIRTQTVFGTLDRAMKSQGEPKSLRIPRVVAASDLVVRERVNPAVFGDTRSNPNSTTVKEIFEEAGIRDVFAHVSTPFAKKWRQQVPPRFVQDTLDSILQRRHNVAHRADALTISRKDLRDAVRFLRILGETLDQGLRSHIASAARSARTRRRSR